MNEIVNIMFSERPLLITREGYHQVMMSLLPLLVRNKSEMPEAQSFFLEMKTYKTKAQEAFENIKKILHEDKLTEAISVTNEFSSPDIPADSIAYHRVWGFITACSHYYFSTKQLEQDLKEADANPQISAHLLHVNSSGGEAWYLDRLSETLDSLQKPVYTLCENCMCSAAYHIGCHGKQVYAVTQNDLVGCIGTMTSFHDYEGWYEQMGIKLVEAKATNSTLKNKIIDDLIDGKPEQFVHEILDPLNDQFLTDVRSHRKQLADADADNPVLRGEVYYASRGQEMGLVDGLRTLPEVIAELAGEIRAGHERNYILDHI